MQCYTIHQAIFTSTCNHAISDLEPYYLNCSQMSMLCKESGWQSRMRTIMLTFYCLDNMVLISEIVLKLAEKTASCNMALIKYCFFTKCLVPLLSFGTKIVQDLLILDKLWIWKFINFGNYMDLQSNTDCQTV